ncbi:hypothetical protein OROHE_023940 [Orobanche hederae]
MTLKFLGTTTLHHRLCLDTRCLLRYAVTSRLLVLSLIIIWRSLLSPYDTSALINPPCLSTSNSSSPPQPVLLPSVGSSIESSIVWDGVYFIRIAECGYEYEQTYAFLPLFPLCVSFLSKTVFAPLVPVIGYRAALGLSGYILNNIAFVFASLYLYRLSVIVLKNKEYSESLYAFLSFGGLYYFFNGTNFFATFWLALSGCARSNGVLNAGYICFRSMQQLNEAFISRKRSYLLMTKILLAGAIYSMCIFTPFISFQVYGYLNICMGRPVAEMRPWCKASLPLLYNYIQSHYWYCKCLTEKYNMELLNGLSAAYILGVGFLRYFQVKQLPNFLLASPILSLATCSIAHYVKLWPGFFFLLGLRVSCTKTELAASPLSTRAEGLLITTGFSEDDTPNVLQDDRTFGVRKREGAIKKEDAVTQSSKGETPRRPQYYYDPVVIFPFVLHLSFMVATAFLVMHVQLRLVSYLLALFCTGSPRPTW